MSKKKSKSHRRYVATVPIETDDFWVDIYEWLNRYRDVIRDEYRFSDNGSKSGKQMLSEYQSQREDLELELRGIIKRLRKELVAELWYGGAK